MILKRLRNTLLSPLLINQRFLFVVWTVVALVAILLKYSTHSYNNFRIYTGVFDHWIGSLPLYGAYPAEYFDMNHYGIVFGLIIAPFALLPTGVGLMLWVMCGVFGLFWAIGMLPLERKWQAVIIWLSLNELFTATIYQQFNVVTVLLLILGFLCVERRRESFAAFTIVLGALVKIYGPVGLAFFPFMKNRVKFIKSLLLWTVVLSSLPILFTDYHYVWAQYTLWFDDIRATNVSQLFAPLQNISLLGVVRKISGCVDYKDIWIIGGGAVLFALSYLRRSQYGYINFRMMILASILLFIPLMSTSSENCSYLTAIIGVGIWWAITPKGRNGMAWTLLVMVVIASFAGNILPQKIYDDYFLKYALKAIPFTLVWLRISYELLTCNFQTIQIKQTVKSRGGEFDLKSCDIDIVLPCYNPTADWIEVIQAQFDRLKAKCPNHNFNLIVANDGSHLNFNDEYVAKLYQAIPGVVVINNVMNMGKGAALRSGVAAAHSPLILYTDIDFPYTTQSICYLITELETGSYDILLARRNQSYHSELSLMRRLLSWGSRTLNQKVLGMRYADAQGGLKGFNRVGRELFLQTTIERFLFDTEFIYMASQRTDITMNQITADLRENIILPAMGMGVVRREFMNFLKILFNR